MKRFIKKILAGVLAISLAVSGTVLVQNPKNEVKAVAVKEWEQVWSDEFNGTALDQNVWSYETGNGNWGWGNGEIEYYTSRKDNVDVSNGTLKIIAKKENYGGQKFTSGRIISKGKKSFKYGKMEARIKVENGNQNGVWPAFWMMGEKGNWPDQGELDIMEHANAKNYVGGCIHWNPNGFGGAYDHSYSGGDYYFSDNVNNGINGWHVYGVIWDSKHIEWQVDGKTYHTERFNSENDYCFQQKQFFLLNLAIAGPQTPYTGGVTAPEDYKTATMYVDYVKVYQEKQVPTTEYTGPYVTVTEDSIAEHEDSWISYFSDTAWTQAKGTLTANGTPSDGFTMNATSIGKAVDKDSIWGIQGQLLNLHYYPGNTYQYQCTITSDKNKKVYVKVADENENVVAGGYVDLEANKPYHYETDVKIDEDFDGIINLKFGMGIEQSGDFLGEGQSVNIKVENLSFTTTATIPDPNWQAPTTTEVVTPRGEEKTTLAAATTKSTDGITLGQAKVKKAKKKLSSAKVKISLKKIKGADKYQVQISKTKKFKKKLVKKTVKKVKTTIKSKKLRNKKKLYLRVRAVKIAAGNKYYGNWSKAKKIKIRK